MTLPLPSLSHTISSTRELNWMITQSSPPLTWRVTIRSTWNLTSTMRELPESTSRNYRMSSTPHQSSTHSRKWENSKNHPNRRRSKTKSLPRTLNPRRMILKNILNLSRRPLSRRNRLRSNHKMNSYSRMPSIPLKRRVVKSLPLRSVWRASPSHPWTQFPTTERWREISSTWLSKWWKDMSTPWLPQSRDSIS